MKESGERKYGEKTRVGMRGAVSLRRPSHGERESIERERVVRERVVKEREW